MVVDVNKLKCNFVHEVAKYITCGKYSLDCCSTKALRAWLDYKLATFTDCEISAEANCYLQELEPKDYVLDCNDAITILDCNDQINLNLSKLIQSCTISSMLSNPDNGSKYPKFNLTSNTTYPVATINVVTTSSCGDSNTTAISSGCQPDVNGDLQCHEEFNPHARITLDLENVRNPGNTGYYKRLWIAQTTTPATLSNIFEIDISPTTSPYRTCSGCTTVDPAEMVFDHPNFAVAMTTLLRNAMWVLYGDFNNGDFKVENSVNGSGSKGYKISSLVKHNPTTTWVGLSKWQSYLNYDKNGADSYTVPGNTVLTQYDTFMQVNYSVPLVTCTPATIVVQGLVGMNLSSASNMHQLVLNSTNSTYALTPTNAYTWNCSKTTLTADVTASSNIATKEWSDSGGIISTDLSITANDTGTYTFNIELDNGCSATDSIIV